MGCYMTVVLKDAHKNDLFINLLNQQLTGQFGSNTGTKFITWEYVEGEADYINNNPEGLQQLTHWERPVTVAQLVGNFYWYRIGEFSFKLSACPNSDEARDAAAVCKWIVQTGGRYINKDASDNYQLSIVRQYLDDLFSEAGYDLDAWWTIPVIS